MTRPPTRSARCSQADLETAIEWLRCNEGGEGEAAACQRAANWLERTLEQRRNIARRRAHTNAHRAAVADLRRRYL